MRSENEKQGSPDGQPFAFRTAEEIRQRKTEILFTYLRGLQELNKQLRLLEIREEIARINQDHDRALAELFEREAK